jgi:adenine C2-methylase RlmN of 23S rRNA A2503 and tRNA A37
MGVPVRKGKRSRKAPSPNSILDRKAFEQALDDRGLEIKAMHIDTFYQALHRQHYPDLSEFVDNYYQFEKEANGRLSQTNANAITSRPLKNNVSSRKNRNKAQLPRKLLEFLKDPKNGFVTVTSKVALRKTSGDETTTKLAIQLHDGLLIESVLMRYISKDGSRASLCVSSQCGCAMGCVSNC